MLMMMMLFLPSGSYAVCISVFALPTPAAPGDNKFRAFYHVISPSKYAFPFQSQKKKKKQNKNNTFDCKHITG